MCPSVIEIASKTAEKNSAQTNKQTDKRTTKKLSDSVDALNVTQSLIDTGQDHVHVTPSTNVTAAHQHKLVCVRICISQLSQFARFTSLWFYDCSVTAGRLNERTDYYSQKAKFHYASMVRSWFEAGSKLVQS